MKISPKIEVANFRDMNQGRCVVAINNILENEVFFAVSRDSIFNIETCKFSKRYQDVDEKMYDNIGR